MSLKEIIENKLTNKKFFTKYNFFLYSNDTHFYCGSLDKGTLIDFSALTFNRIDVDKHGIITIIYDHSAYFIIKMDDDNFILDRQSDRDDKLGQLNIF